MKDINRNGLTEQEVASARAKYGVNLLTPPRQTPWWRLYLEKFQDPIIVILLFATLISLIFGFMHGEYTESVGIICAVLLATGVGFWQEYSAKKKFDAMKSDKDFEPVKVRRDGVVVEIGKDQIVVGDVVVLTAGDEVPADIELFASTEMKVAEAAMTGESVAVGKYPIDEPYTGSGFAPNLLLRGTNVEQGMGEGIVVSVGDATEIGKTTRQASEETDNETPLQIKLTELASVINKVAFGIAGTMFVILNLMHWDFAFGDAPFSWSLEALMTEVQFLMGAVVVVIVAVPEGLPLSVTLALAFSMKTMAKENNLVKKMHACETIGAVNVIFTDKTGTLTQNQMRVVDYDVEPDNLPLLNLVGALNSTATWSNREQVLGNPTESAILKAMGRGHSEQLRAEYQVLSCIPFSSAYKYMVSHVQSVKSYEECILIKGAPEVVARIIGKHHFLPTVAQQQARGRRAIAAAVIAGKVDYDQIEQRLKRGEPIPEWEYVGTWFIEDPVRGDVPEAAAREQPRDSPVIER